MARNYPNVVIRRNVRNQSSRKGVQPDLIVIHTTESHNRPGNSDLAAIEGWFDDPRSSASSHVVTDGDGRSARLVSDDAKAWTCVNYNSRSLNIEQIGFAADSDASWFKRREELRETARWIAYWSRKHNIPIRRVKPNRSGVVGHLGLGVAGGGHHDPGLGFPWRYVLLKARQYRALQS